jgi:hypothetical protein
MSDKTPTREQVEEYLVTIDTIVTKKTTGSDVVAALRAAFDAQQAQIEELEQDERESWATSEKLRADNTALREAGEIVYRKYWEKDNEGLDLLIAVEKLGTVLARVGSHTTKTDPDNDVLTDGFAALMEVWKLHGKVLSTDKKWEKINKALAVFEQTGRTPNPDEIQVSSPAYEDGEAK